MVLRMTRPIAPETPTYWETVRAAAYIPAADYVARMRAREIPDTLDGDVTRCTVCGQWTWGGVCSLHPAARQDHY